MINDLESVDPLNKAVFLDRDGTLIELLYDEETGYIDSVTKPTQIRLKRGVAEALRKLKNAGYMLILVSNQPGIAKRRMTVESFEATKDRLDELLLDEGVILDAEYYCFHHPDALMADYRKICSCRKPTPGMILRGADQFYLDLSQCYLVGDDLVDVRAGVAAGCRTVLLAHVTGYLFDILNEKEIKPDAIKSNLVEAADWIILSSHFLTSKKLEIVA